MPKKHRLIEFRETTPSTSIGEFKADLRDGYQNGEIKPFWSDMVREFQKPEYFLHSTEITKLANVRNNFNTLGGGIRHWNTILYYLTLPTAGSLANKLASELIQRHYTKLNVNSRKPLNSVDETDDIRVTIDDNLTPIQTYKNISDSDWLNPFSDAHIPFVRRESELQTLNSFLHTDEGLQICAIVGPSGFGKTRLAVEFARRVDDEWVVGFVRGRDPSKWHSWRPLANTLMIIDYSHLYDEVINAVIDRFESNYGMPNTSCIPKVRILLLDYVYNMSESFKKINNHSILQNTIVNTNVIDETPASDEQDFEGEEVPDEMADIMNAIWRIMHANEIEENNSDKHVSDNYPITFNRSSQQRHRKNLFFNPQVIDLRRSPDSPSFLREIIACLIREEASELLIDECFDYINEMSESAQCPLFAAIVAKVVTYNINSQRHYTRRYLTESYFSSDTRLPWRSEFGIDYQEGLIVGRFISIAILLRGENFSTLNRSLPTSFNYRTRSRIKQRCLEIVSGNDRNFLKNFEPDIFAEIFLMKYLEEILDSAAAESEFIHTLVNATQSDNTLDKCRQYIDVVECIANNLIEEGLSERPFAYRAHAYSEFEGLWVTLLHFLKSKYFLESTLISYASCIAISRISKRLFQNNFPDLHSKFFSEIALTKLIAALDTDIVKEAADAIMAYYCVKVELEETSRGLEDLMLQVTYKLGEIATEHNLAFEIAFDANHSAMVAFLLKQNDHSNYIKKYGQYYISMASSNGFRDTLEILLNEGLPATGLSDTDLDPPLTAATAHGHLEVVELLLRRGGNPDEYSTEYGCPLMASIDNNFPEIARVLLEYGADPNWTSERFQSFPLYRAVQSESVEIVEVLLESTRVDVNKCHNVNQETALFEAIFKRNFSLVDSLLKSGADPNIVHSEYGTALDFAIALNIPNIESRLRGLGAKSNTEG